MTKLVYDSNDQTDGNLISTHGYFKPPKKSSNSFHGFLYCLTSAIFSSLGTILVRSAHITTGPEQTLIRYLVQGSLMAVIILSSTNNSQITFLGPTGSRKLLILRGACGTIAMIFLHVSIKLINPGDTVAHLNIKSVLVTMFARCLIDERISIGHLICLASTIFGIGLILQPDVFLKRSDPETDRLVGKLPFIVGTISGMSNLKDVATDSSLIPSTETTLPIPIKARLYEYHGFLIGIFSALLLSLSNILNKKAHITTGAEQTFIRYLIQASFMVIIIKKEKLDFFGPKEFRKILILRGVFGTVGLIALQYSVKLINPSDAVALLHLNSVMVIIFARVYLNEKFTIFHLVCLLTALIGVVFIAQPTFIFDKITNSKNNITEILETHLAPPKGHEFIIGIFLAIFTATLSALVAVCLKKLADKKVHYSIPTIYATYFGIPTSLMISVGALATGITKKDPALLDDLPSLMLQVVYSILAGFCGTISQVTLNLALNYEDAGKISIIRSSDVFFTYLFQFIWLGISTNVFSGIGAALIIFGTVMIMAQKILDKKAESENKTEKRGIILRILMKKF